MSESIIILTVIGAALGSFLNVCVYRIPRRIAVATPGSFCPHCHRALRWYELVPVVSFAFQRGRCRSCHNRIPIQYPLVEILTASLAVALFGLYGITGELIMSFTFVSLMILVAIIDWRHLLISNKVVISGLVIGTVLRTIFQESSVIPSIVAAMVSFGTMLLLRLGSNWLFSAGGGSACGGNKETMGMGDLKLAALIGLFIGLQGFLVSLWGASILGSVYGAVRYAARSAVTNLSSVSTPVPIVHQLPFGSFLAVTSSLVLLFQDSVNTFIESWLTWTQ